MQIFVYLTRRRNITHIYTLSETDTDVLKGWSAAFIANDKETKWIAKSNIASSPSTRGNGCSFCTLAAEKKNFIMLSLSCSLPSSLSFLFSSSLAVHHIANVTSPQYISLSDFIDLWPIMSQFASSTLFMPFLGPIHFDLRNSILSSVPMEHTFQVPSVQKKQSPNIWDCDKV